MSVEAIRASLRSQVPEPVFTEDMTHAEIDAEWQRHLAAFRALTDRLDEEHRLLGIGRTAAILMTHELVWEWLTATADRWFRALPERYMTPDSMTRPDWDHKRYPHDEHGHIGRVTTLQRPEPESGSAEAQQIELARAILADLDAEAGS